MDASHKTALAREIEVKTEPLDVGLGVAPLEVQPRPDLSGLRVQAPNQPAIYLIDPEGYRRWIPNPATYNNLFRNWEGVVVDINIIDIAQGENLTDGAVLAQGIGTAPIYLVSNGLKRWITSPAAMDKYYFNWATVVRVPQVMLDSIPSGLAWS